MSWVNEDGVSGLNVEPGDPQALADAIRRICDDREVWQRYAEGARMRFERMFTAQSMIDKMTDIYERKC